MAKYVGIEALKKGYKLAFVHIDDLVARLISAKGDGIYFNVLKNFLTLNLLIIDEVGFKKISISYVDEFFEVVRMWYETFVNNIDNKEAF